MPNRLAHATSPYLRQHAQQPVDWYPWGEEALTKARAEDKPIFLSIGYAACHWCHVMAHESFEDPTIAALLNAHFVPIKVDREEHPDVDKVYMEAVMAMTGHGGWPLTVFLTPEGEPFYGGTYFPPTPRHNLPGLKDLLEALAHAWQHDRARVLDAARAARQHVQAALRAALPPQGSHRLHPGLAEQAVAAVHRRYDARFGGWQRKGPKFPQAALGEFLLRMGQRGHPMARHMALHTLAMMARGGLYDVLGGGFHRYSVDAMWRVPHFEKMLYDNALLARVYGYAYLLSGEQGYARVAQETLDFVLREMAHPEGGFYASLDADSDGREGAFYVWTRAEVEALLPSEDFELFCAAYCLEGPPTFEGDAYVLQRQASDRALADRFGLTAEQVAERLARARAVLRAARAQRPRPGVDDKILVGWNGLMVWALAEVGFYLRRADYVRAAQRTAVALEDAAAALGHWPRGWHQGRPLPRPAYLEDRAAWALGLLALYRADGDPRWFAAAGAQVEAIGRDFADPEGGWYEVAATVDAPLVRPKVWDDGAVPGGQSLTATLWLQWAAYTTQPDYQAQVEALLRGLAPLLARHAVHYGQWLNVLDTVLGPRCEVAVVYPPRSDPQALLGVLGGRWRPRSVWAASPAPPEAAAAPLVQQRPPVEQRPTAYVCQGMTCQPPLTDPAAFERLLSGLCTPSAPASSAPSR